MYVLSSIYENELLTLFPLLIQLYYDLDRKILYLDGALGLCALADLLHPSHVISVEIEKTTGSLCFSNMGVREKTHLYLHRQTHVRIRSFIQAYERRLTHLATSPLAAIK
jgi:hypothetical protein